MATYTQALQEVRAELAELKRRQNQIDANTIDHLDRILDILEHGSVTVRIPADGGIGASPPANPDPQPANPLPVSSDYPPDVQNAIEAAKHIVATGGTLANWVDDAINNQGTLGQHEYEVRMEAANAVVGYGVWKAWPAHISRGMWAHLTAAGLLNGIKNPRP